MRVPVGARRCLARKRDLHWPALTWALGMMGVSLTRWLPWARGREGSHRDVPALCHPREGGDPSSTPTAPGFRYDWIPAPASAGACLPGNDTENGRALSEGGGYTGRTSPPTGGVEEIVGQRGQSGMTTSSTSSMMMSACWASGLWVRRMARSFSRTFSGGWVTLKKTEE